MADVIKGNPARFQNFATSARLLWQTRVERRQKRRQTRVLAELDDHIRRDIGILELGSAERAIQRQRQHHYGW